MTTSSKRCRACGGDTVAHQTLVIRNEPVALDRCPTCGLFQFSDPTWLDAAYADPIADIDIGLPARCLAMARLAEAVIRAQGTGRAQHLDYGGGYALLTRLLRDRGIDARHHDPFARNLFAQGFEGTPAEPHGSVSVVEVLEHLTDPFEVLRDLAATSDLIIVSTVLVPPGQDDLDGWWYTIPDLGQHVTFFTQEALGALAARLGLGLCTDGVSVHLLHRGKLRPLTRAVVRRQRLAAPVAALLRKRDRASSLAPADSAMIV